MDITLISDTHGQHNDVIFNNWIKAIPNKEKSIIIHAGDISSMGHIEQIVSFLDWYRLLPYAYRIFCAGNHDFGFEKQPEIIKSILKNYPEIIYLENQGVTIEGINIYGSPASPFFFNWAFNYQRGEDIKKIWNKIPDQTDILVTHGPAYGHGDRVVRGNKEKVGCKDLLETIEKIKPRYHVSGHIQEGYSITYNENTTFINASTLDENYDLVNKPIVIKF